MAAHEKAARARRRRARVRAVLWVGSVGAVVATGLVCLPREYPEMGFWQSLYSTARLFVFEYDQPHFPQTWPLVVIHFAAPVISLSAVWTAVSRLFHLTPALRMRWHRDHVVVCGVGHTGKLIAATLKADGVPVVGVDISEDEELEDWAMEHKIPLVQGTFHSGATLERAGARRARSLLFASGDDLGNLEGAVAAYDWLHSNKKPHRIIWTHVANERLAATAGAAVRTRGTVALRFFDTYRIAATAVVANHFGAEVRRGLRRVTIIGFGKFGRDLFDVLVRDLRPDEEISLRVVDRRDVDNQVSRLAEELSLRGGVEFVRANIDEFELEDESDDAFLLCTDDDMGNLTAAMRLAAKVTTTHIYVRMQKWPMSAIADHLGEEHGVVFVNIDQLVAEGIRALPGIFEPARATDL